MILAAALIGPALAQWPSASIDYTPLKIIQTREPHFPFQLQSSPVMDGEARVVVNIDSEGRLVDWLVTGYTRREFADTAVEALKSWQYEPARLRGQKCATVREIDFNFSRTGVVISLTSIESLENQIDRMMPGRHLFRTFQLRELDRIPVPSKVVPPEYPESLAAKGARGSVVVEFYIDPTGQVRMPAALKWDEDALADLAVAAVSQWRFEPPRAKGQPVLAIARQEFKFQAKP